MKIAMFSDCFLDLPGGIPAVMRAEKKELEKRGHTVYIFSSAYPKNRAEIQRLARENIFVVPSCRVLLRGVTPMARRPGVVEKWLLKEHPEILDFDVFYVHYEAGCSIAALRLGREHKIPTVQVMHGREDVGEANLIPRGFRTLVAAALNWFHSWYLPHPVKNRRDNYLAETRASAKMWELMVNHANYADLVLTPSQHFAAKLKHYGVTREIMALAHGVDDGLCDEKREVRNFRAGETLELIWHSRVSGEKRIMVLLEALRKVEGSVHLDVYGTGNQLEKAKKFVFSHNLNVDFHGQTDFSKIYAKICQADLDVLISYNFDTFGMTLIEAESAGTPVLIADPELSEAIPEGSFALSKDPSAEAIAEALNEIIRQPEKIAEMSAKMISGREKIKISKKVDALLKIFESLAAKS